MQTPSALHIGRLRLRVPGSDAEAGRGFAHQFADELASQCAGIPTVRIGALHLRVAMDPGEADNPSAVAARAAQAVVARLNSGGQGRA